MGKRGKRNEAKKVDVPFARSKNGLAKLKVAQNLEEGSGKTCKEYTFSWIGENGQPGSQTIKQGASCYILPDGQADSSTVQRVSFNSFQLAAKEAGGSGVGTMRYKTQNGKHLALCPGAVGPRFLLPQIEQWGVSIQQQPPQSAGSSAEAPGTEQQPAVEECSSEEEEEAARPQKRRRTAEQSAKRREKDDQARAACRSLQQNAEWHGQETSTFTVRTTKFASFQLGRKARCNAFGMDLYSMLKKTTFHRCIPCGTVFVERKTAPKHQCGDRQGSRSMHAYMRGRTVIL